MFNIYKNEFYRTLWGSGVWLKYIPPELKNHYLRGITDMDQGLDILAENTLCPPGFPRNTREFPCISCKACWVVWLTRVSMPDILLWTAKGLAEELRLAEIPEAEV